MRYERLEYLAKVLNYKKIKFGCYDKFYFTPQEERNFIQDMNNKNRKQGTIYIYGLNLDNNGYVGQKDLLGLLSVNESTTLKELINDIYGIDI